MTEAANPSRPGGKRPCAKVDKVTWWHSLGNLATLLEWMQDNGYTHAEQMQALRKPWNYEREFTQAVLEVGVIND